jgi:hypothetical protein
MLSLFELTTMDNWPSFMHTGMDAAGVDVQPVSDRSSSFSLFFVVFICVSAFFLTRAFIGVFIKQVTTSSRCCEHVPSSGMRTDIAMALDFERSSLVTASITMSSSECSRSDLHARLGSVKKALQALR